MQISWEKSKRRLSGLWFIGAGLIFLIILIQSILGRYGEDITEVWAWFLPTIMPTLSLIIGVFVYDTIGNGVKFQSVDRFFFRLSFSLSLAYLIVVLMTILLKPFSPLDALELMKNSNLWLGPFQGLVTGSLGAFFIKGKKG